MFSSLKHKINIPLPGQRIHKTMVAVFLCLLVFYFRGYRGMISESIITAIICVQPYNRDSKESARNRFKGTLLGAAWGLMFLYLFRSIPNLTQHRLVLYAMMALGIGIVLYSSVLTRLNDAAALSAIVFICIIIDYPQVDTPVITTLNRIVDLSIGLTISLLVNKFHIPGKKHPEKVFFVRLQDLVEDRFSSVSPRILIELNRLYDDGAKICLESRWAPAFLMSQMGFLHNINMPIIVMNGAALYDIRENSFVEVVETNKISAARLHDFLLEEGYGYLAFAIRENVMHTFRIGPMSPGEDVEFDLMRRSPYRNYVDGMYHHEDRIAVIRVLVPKKEVLHFHDRLYAERLHDLFAIDVRKQPRLDDYIGFYFQNPEATMENMENHLMELQEDPESLTMCRILPRSEHHIPKYDAPQILHRVRREYSTIFASKKRA